MKPFSSAKKPVGMMRLMVATQKTQFERSFARTRLLSSSTFPTPPPDTVTPQRPSTLELRHFKEDTSTNSGATRPAQSILDPRKAQLIIYSSQPAI